jgi:hypothetical protein
MADQFGRFSEHMGNAKLICQLFPIFLAAAGDGHNLIVREEPEYRNVTITAPVPDPNDSNPNFSAAVRIHD